MHPAQFQRVTALISSSTVADIDLDADRFTEIMTRFTSRSGQRPGELMLALLFRYVGTASYDHEFWRVTFQQCDVWEVDDSPLSEGVWDLRFRGFQNLDVGSDVGYMRLFRSSVVMCGEQRRYRATSTQDTLGLREDEIIADVLNAYVQKLRRAAIELLQSKQFRLLTALSNTSEVGLV